MEKEESAVSFHALEKLEAKYESGQRRKVENPEEYAVKNWIVQMQGFLINCATYGFTSNYEKIMDGEYGYVFYIGHL